MAEAFRDPKIGIGKLYTRGGDAGDTSLVGGQRVAKDDLRIAAYGCVDELNAVIGWARTLCDDPALGDLARDLLRVQHQLFNLGSILATLPDDQAPDQPRIRDSDVAWLEARIDHVTGRLPALTSFVLPGGSAANAALHVARTVCRRLERALLPLRRQDGCAAVDLQYINRLSDALFAWARQAAADAGRDETLWDPNAA